MKITSQEEYGLRCLVQIARQQSTDGPDMPHPISQIAKAEGISVEYAGKLLSLLRQGGLVRSVRGKHGGYVLNHDASEITLLDVVTALSGPIFRTDTCARFSGQEADCVHLGDCGMRPVWSALSGIIGNLLESITISDLCLSESDVASCICNDLESQLNTLRNGENAISLPSPARRRNKERPASSATSASAR